MGSRVRNVIIGLVVLAAGVAGLLLPMSAFDGNSSTVACGNAVVASKVPNPPKVDQAAPAPGFVPDLAAACDSAISDRRHWAVPLVIVGAAGVLLGLFARGRRKP